MSGKVARSAIAGAPVAVGLGIAACLFSLLTREPPGDAQVLDTSALSCGPTALLAAAESYDRRAYSRLARVLAHDPNAAEPVVSLHALAQWCRQAGLEAVGLRVQPAALNRLPLPVIAHLRPGHFVTLLSASPEQVTICDRPGAPRRVSRHEFERWFSGHVLCLQTELGRPRAGLGGKEP